MYNYIYILNIIADYINNISENHILLALIGGLICWALTAFGALAVFVIKINKNNISFILGLAGGIMIAASFWSLLSPALEIAEKLEYNPALTACIGFLCGGILITALNKLIPHVHTQSMSSQEITSYSKKRKTALLFSALTIHNIPEGLAVGVAFGSLSYGFDTMTLWSAIALTLGIAIQDIPEGAAAAIPMLDSTKSKGKSFFYGQLSGSVEPIAAVIGAWAVSVSEAILPFALSFAAGAMIFVVAEEIIPEAMDNKNDITKHVSFGTWGVMLGFAIMMFLDVSLS